MEQKKNKEDFIVPQRQSPFSLLFIAGDSLRRLFNITWPLLLIFYLGQSTSWFNYYLIFIAIISILFSLTTGVLEYLRYTYYIIGNKFIISKGIFRRTRISVPFDRIQVVRVDETILHRWTGTNGLTIETAGTTTEELKIKALSHLDANALKEILMPKDKGVKKELEPTFDESLQEHTIIKHSILDTILVGLTQNHFKSAWYIAAFFMFLFSQTYEVIGEKVIDTVLDSYESLFAFNLIIGASAVILTIISSILVSMVIATLQYYGMRVNYDGNHLKVKAGLFNRKEDTVRQKRIQIYKEETNPLRKLIDFISIDIQQPVSSSEMMKRSISIAGVHSSDIDMFRSFTLQETQFLFPIPIHSERVVIFRRFLYLGLVPVGLLIAPAFYYFQWSGLLVLGILPLVYLLAVVWHRKLSIEFSQDHIIRRGGIITSYNVFTDYSKIQTVTLSQTPYQVRNNLCNLRIYTAGGSISYPYLTVVDGKKVRDYLLYRLETGPREWM